jgi:hypothetical protein
LLPWNCFQTLKIFSVTFWAWKHLQNAPPCHVTIKTPSESRRWHILKYTNKLHLWYLFEFFHNTFHCKKTKKTCIWMYYILNKSIDTDVSYWPRERLLVNRFDGKCPVRNRFEALYCRPLALLVGISTICLCTFIYIKNQEKYIVRYKLVKMWLVNPHKKCLQLYILSNMTHSLVSLKYRTSKSVQLITCYHVPQRPSYKWSIWKWHLAILIPFLIFLTDLFFHKSIYLIKIGHLYLSYMGVFIQRRIIYF